MKKPFTLLALLLLSLVTFTQTPAQTPKFHLLAGMGVWRPWIAYDDPYASRYQRYQASFGIGAGMDFPISEKAAFSPEVGIHGYGHHYRYWTRSPFSQEVDLFLMYARLSLGVKFNLSPSVSIRLGLNGLVYTSGIGSYELSWIDHTLNARASELHTDQFSKITRFGNFGPEVGIGYSVPLRNSGMISPRLNSFAGLVPTFGYSRRAPFSPFVLQCSFELCYTFPNAAKNHENH